MSFLVPVCRGCLATASECKLYDMRQHGLLTAYRQILQHTNRPVCGGLRPYMCSYCATLLIKCSSFRDRCMRVQDLLEDISKSNIKVTAECINAIDRVSNKLTIPLVIDRNVYTIDCTHTYTQVKEETDEELIEDTVESFIKETDSDQDLLNEILNSEAVALVIGDVTEIMSESDPGIKKVKEAKKKGKGCKESTDKDKSKNGYEVVKILHNINDISENLSDAKSDDHAENNNDFNEMCSASDIDDVSYSIIKEEEESDDTVEEIDNISSDENTDREEILNEMSCQSDVADIVNEYLRTSDKHSAKGESKIIEENEKLVRRRTERQYKPKIDDDTFSKQYNVDVIKLSKEEQRADLETRKDSANYKESPYKCKMCFTGWNREETFNNHLQKHSVNNGPFGCEICGYRFQSRTSCRKHRITHQFKLVCQLCSFVSKSRYMARWHHKRHAGHTFKCDLCGACHPSLSGHLSHRRMKHPAAAAATACPQCGEVFLGGHGLKVHRLKTAGDCRPLAGYQSRGYQSGGQRKCHSCGLRFMSADSLEVHKRRMHEMKLPLNPITDPKVPQDEFRRTPNGRFICEVCGKTFLRQSVLRFHLMVHSGVYPFECPLCFKGFVNKGMLMVHSRVHSGERPYHCGLCGLSFNVKSNYNRHMAVHTGEKPYKCEICGRCFAQASAMRGHIRTVHMKLPGPPRRRKGDGMRRTRGPLEQDPASDNEVGAEAMELIAADTDTD